MALSKIESFTVNPIVRRICANYVYPIREKKATFANRLVRYNRIYFANRFSNVVIWRRMAQKSCLPPSVATLDTVHRRCCKLYKIINFRNIW